MRQVGHLPRITIINCVCVCVCVCDIYIYIYTYIYSEYKNMSNAVVCAEIESSYGTISFNKGPSE